jgi:hypothetical protein
VGGSPTIAADLYDILQVAPNADQETITASFRRLLFKFHPDHNASADAAAKTAEITRAYRVLGDAEERQRYDQTRTLPGPHRRDVPRVVLGLGNLTMYDWLDIKPKHRAIQWRDGIWGQISSQFPLCKQRHCLVLLQIDPLTGHQIYQHGDPGPVMEIDPGQGEFRLIKQWLEDCHATEDGRWG